METTSSDSLAPSGFDSPLVFPAAPAPPKPLPPPPDREAERRAADQAERPSRRRAQAPLLSIVIPVYNEEHTVCTVIGQVRALSLDKEIIVVDDCSTDLTRHMLARLIDEGDLRVIFKSRNEGKGAALREGFAIARGEIVVVQDADLEYDPQDIPRLLEPILQGEADVVYGSRFLGDPEQDPSRLHRLANGLLTWASNRATGLRLTDMETCYKAFRRELLQDLPLRQNRFGIEPELTAKLARRGARFRELPIRYQARRYAEGKKIGFRDGLNAFYCILRYAVAD